MNRSMFGVVGAVALSLTTFACSNTIGHGARIAPGPDAYGQSEEQAAVKTANGALPAPGVEAYPANTVPVTAKGALPAPGPATTAVESAAR